MFSDRGQDLSLYGGLARVAFVLNETGKATGKEKYCEAARAATDDIVRAAKAVGSGLAWSEAPGIAGGGGIVLYLLYVAREFGSDLYSITAERAGDHILELATNERRGGGFRWVGFPAFPGLPKDAYLPNFGDGTAGISYVFARLYVETKKARYLFAAKQGALHLQSISAPAGKAELITQPLSDPPDLHYAGHGHEPEGPARTFFELFTITHEPTYQEWAERLANFGLQRNELEYRTPGHRNIICHCCSSATLVLQL